MSAEVNPSARAAPAVPANTTGTSTEPKVRDGTLELQSESFNGVPLIADISWPWGVRPSGPLESNVSENPVHDQTVSHQIDAADHEDAPILGQRC